MNKIKAVDMVRQIRDQHYEKTKNMTPAELISWYHRKAKTVNAQVQILLKRERAKK
jgi:hypothetical protein